jgi:hypothetical protein
MTTNLFADSIFGKKAVCNIKTHSDDDVKNLQTNYILGVCEVFLVSHMYRAVRLFS